MPDEPNDLDEKDRAILQAITEHPHATVEELVGILKAAKVKMPMATARKRLQRLIRQEQLERVLRIAGPRQRYRIDLYINPRALYSKDWKPKHEDADLGPQEDLALQIEDLFNTEAFKGKLICDDIAVLLGHRADLSIRLRSTSADDIRHFITGKDGLRKLPEIQNTHTAREVWSTSAYRKQKPEYSLTHNESSTPKTKTSHHLAQTLAHHA